MMGKPFDPKSREAWGNAGKAKGMAGSRNFAATIRTAKGMGPNKACGHKGGISRQGSKR